MKHTKGPWFVESTPIESSITTVIEGTKVELFNIKHIPKRADLSSLGAYNETRANVALIAAAPEMLEIIATIYGLANLQTLLETKYSKALVFDLMKQMHLVLERAGGAE